MPRKNNITIYEKIYQSAVEEFGMWEQIIADCGREFFLCEFVQEYLKDFRIKRDGSICRRPSFKQLTSCKNNRVERLWQEVNAQVGLPIKWAFTEMENNHTLDRHNLTHLFATSFVGCSVAKVLLQRWMDGWNNHTITGKGIPSQYTHHRGNYLLPAGVLPSAAHAAEIYRGSNGQLTDESTFGQDPLEGQPEKQNRRDQIFQNEIDTKLGGFNYIASYTVNHGYQPIQEAVTLYIQLGVSLLSS
uniref:Integrase catalytic domain-containing protein n=1 Tax=Plectus sambesii TaxID=2011161 RepID=A0A914XLZ9_9BILA